jgi:hypothetical protein
MRNICGPNHLHFRWQWSRSVKPCRLYILVVRRTKSSHRSHYRWLSLLLPALALIVRNISQWRFSYDWQWWQWSRSVEPGGLNIMVETSRFANVRSEIDLIGPIFTGPFHGFHSGFNFCVYCCENFFTPSIVVRWGITAGVMILWPVVFQECRKDKETGTQKTGVYFDDTISVRICY